MSAIWSPASRAVGEQLAADLFSQLAELTADPPGVTRQAYGEGERICHDLLKDAASDFGAEIDYDFAGNLFVTLPGEDRSKRIIIASHVDSVTHGGNFDGAAGVIAGVAAQSIFAEGGRKPPFDLTVIALRAEESCWFPYSYIGSKSALGILDPEVVDNIKRSDTGKSLGEHITIEGFDPDAVKRGEKKIDPENVVAYFEPHIEQAPLLELKEIPIGVVTGIRGSFRYRTISCDGEYSHSGAMPREYRKDTVMAASELIVGMDKLWDDVQSEGGDLTVTFGELMTDPEHHGFSKVPGKIHICLDVRSQSAETLERADTRLKDLMADIEKKRGVRFDIGPWTGSDPALMSDHLQGMLSNSASALNVPALSMASGAGHDASVFALQGIPAAMVFIRNTNGSHNADEAMALEDFNAALAVMMETLSQPADAWPTR